LITHLLQVLLDLFWLDIEIVSKRDGFNLSMEVKQLARE
jgi:hypothetical protein